jgi:hypothetical protein
MLPLSRVTKWTLVCAAIVAAALAAPAAHAGSFDSSNPLHRFLVFHYGSAYTVDEEFVLTEAESDQLGSIVLWPLDAKAIVAFQMTATYYIGGGWGADGMSFCFGDLQTRPFNERGTGNGLILRLDTYDNNDGDQPNRIELVYDNTTLAVSDVRTLRGGMFTLTVTVDDLGNCLVLHNNGIDPLTAIETRIADWAPEAGWRFGFGSRTGWFHDYHVITSLTINTTPIPEPGTMALLAVGGLVLMRRRRKRTHAIGAA